MIGEGTGVHAQAGDRDARKGLRTVGSWLGVGVANLVNIFNPEVIVLGGFLRSLYFFDQERLLSGLTNGSLSASREAVIVRTAELGSSGVLLGTAELVFERLMANPGAFEIVPA